MPSRRAKTAQVGRPSEVVAKVAKVAKKPAAKVAKPPKSAAKYAASDLKEAEAAVSGGVSPTPPCESTCNSPGTPSPSCWVLRPRGLAAASRLQGVVVRRTVADHRVSYVTEGLREINVGAVSSRTPVGFELIMESGDADALGNADVEQCWLFQALSEVVSHFLTSAAGRSSFHAHVVRAPTLDWLRSAGGALIKISPRVPAMHTLAGGHAWVGCLLLLRTEATTAATAPVPLVSAVLLSYRQMWSAENGSAELRFSGVIGSLRDSKAGFTCTLDLSRRLGWLDRVPAEEGRRDVPFLIDNVRGGDASVCEELERTPASLLLPHLPLLCDAFAGAQPQQSPERCYAALLRAVATASLLDNEGRALTLLKEVPEKYRSIPTRSWREILERNYLPTIPVWFQETCVETGEVGIVCELLLQGSFAGDPATLLELLWRSKVEGERFGKRLAGIIATGRHSALLNSLEKVVLGKNKKKAIAAMSVFARVLCMIDDPMRALKLLDGSKEGTLPLLEALAERLRPAQRETPEVPLRIENYRPLIPLLEGIVAAHGDDPKRRLARELLCYFPTDVLAEHPMAKGRTLNAQHARLLDHSMQQNSGSRLALSNLVEDGADPRDWFPARSAVTEPLTIPAVNLLCDSDLDWQRYEDLRERLRANAKLAVLWLGRNRHSLPTRFLAEELMHIISSTDTDSAQKAAETLRDWAQWSPPADLPSLLAEHADQILSFVQSDELGKDTRGFFLVWALALVRLFRDERAWAVFEPRLAALLTAKSATARERGSIVLSFHALCTQRDSFLRFAEDPDSAIREGAKSALVDEYCTGSDFPARTLEAYRCSSRRARLVFAEALRHMSHHGIEGAVKKAVKDLDSDDAEQRRKAIQAIDSLVIGCEGKCRGAGYALLMMLADGDAQVRDEAAGALWDTMDMQPDSRIASDSILTIQAAIDCESDATVRESLHKLLELMEKVKSSSS